MSSSRLLAISTLLALAFQGDLLCGVFRMGEDLLAIHYPQQKAAAAGELFFSPRFGPGLDLVAEGQTGIFNPVNVVVRSLPLVWGFALGTLLLQTLAFFGTGLWLRRLGFGDPACLLGLLVYGGSLCLLLRIEQWPNFQAACWLPLILWGRARGDARGLAVAAFGLGCALTAGAPQFALWIVVAWLLDGFLHGRHSWKRTLGFACLGTLLAAWPLWSMWELTLTGERVGGLAATGHSLPWRHLAGWVLPFPFGHPARGAYLGGGPIWEFSLFAGILTFVMFWRAGPLKYRAVVLLLLAMMLGDRCPLTSWVYGIPPFDMFRVPPRAGFVLVIFLAAGAARALEFGPSRWSPGRRFEQIALFFGAMVGGALYVARDAGAWPALVGKVMDRTAALWETAAQKSAHSAGYFHHAFEVVLWELGLQLVVAGAVLAVGHRLWRLGRRRSVVVLVGLELLLSAHLVRTTVEDSTIQEARLNLPSEIRGLVWIDPAAREAARVAAGERQGSWLERTLAARPFIPGVMTDGRIRDPLHHSPLRSSAEKRWQRLLANRVEDGQVLRRAGVLFVREGDDWGVVVGAPAILFYAGDFENVDEPIEERLPGSNPLYSLHREDGRLDVPAATLTDSDRDGRHIVDLGGTRPSGWVRFDRTWHPGWRARVDGKSVPVHRVDMIKTGIRVPAGAKVVSLSLEPGIPFLPAILMAGAWLTTALLWSARTPVRMDR